MSIQYQTGAAWDATLIYLEYTDSSTAPAALQGLVKYAIKKTTGAPTATAGKFIEGAMIANAVDSQMYLNTGTTASPTWTVMDTAGAGGITALTGDVTASGNGSVAATIASGAVELSMLASAISPVVVAKFAGTATWSGGGATLAHTVTGALATDIVVATVKVKATEASYLVSAVASTDTVTFELSTANTTNDAEISYVVLRATS
jgi:hypothetical protein